MSNTIECFIISSELQASTDWQASPWCNVGPVIIYSGTYSGQYAVNTSIFSSDTSFESFRTLLEAQPVAAVNVSDLRNPNEVA